MTLRIGRLLLTSDSDNNPDNLSKKPSLIYMSNLKLKFLNIGLWLPKFRLMLTIVYYKEKQDAINGYDKCKAVENEI